MYKILFADDETKIRETVRDYMSAKGLDVSVAENGKEAVEQAEDTDFDLIILDVMMPVKNGIDACTAIRKNSNVPILFLSALGEEHDLLRGYGSGADDYIVKPFPLAVLYEKCMTMIKRYRGVDKENRISLSGITLDKNTVKVYVDDREITLSNKDFQLLEYLMVNKNIVLNRSIILSRVWGYEFDGDDRVVDTHIKIIRKALGSSAECIKTVVNVGYCFEVK
ncbi:MAG: response regulator transcription factor [Clostridia bacterium]|nr:response regulator transcription factor [Clostridia bacterium]